MRYQKKAEIGKSWEFVCTVLQSEKSSNVMVVLKPEAGEYVQVPLNDFQRDFSLLSGKSPAANEAIKETLNNIRQNSTVRFVMLPFFIGGYRYDRKRP